MATTTPTTPTVTTPKLRTKDEAIAHLEEVKVALQGFAGKPQRNPFLYAAEKINPLLTLLKSGKVVVTSKEDGSLSTRAATSEETEKAIVDAFKVSAAEENFTYAPVGSNANAGSNAYGSLNVLSKTVLKPVDPGMA